MVNFQSRIVIFSYPPPPKKNKDGPFTVTQYRMNSYSKSCVSSSSKNLWNFSSNFSLRIRLLTLMTRLTFTPVMPYALKSQVQKRERISSQQELNLCGDTKHTHTRTQQKKLKDTKQVQEKSQLLFCDCCARHTSSDHSNYVFAPIGIVNQ